MHINAYMILFLFPCFRVHKKLNKFFSEYFVCQYLINTGGVCIQFFIINNE